MDFTKALMRAFAVAACLSLGLVAGSSAWALQSMRITSVNGVSVPSSPPYEEYQAYPNEEGYFLIGWTSTDTTCGGGVDEYNIMVDGVYYTTPVSNGATSGVAKVYPQFFRKDTSDPSYNLESLKSCRHTIRLSEFYMLNAGSCNHYVRVPGMSDLLTFWTTPRAQCDGPKDSCGKTAYVGGPVDVATGAMQFKRTDLTMKGPIPIELTRRYDSGSTYNGPLGYGWQHSYSKRLETDGSVGRISLVDSDGHRTYFSRVIGTTNQWEPDDIGHLTLTQPADAPWRVTDKHGMRYDFDSAKRLWKVSDRNGNTLTLSYGTGGRLDAITDSVGHAMTFQYSPDNKHIVLASTGSQLAVYHYTGDDLLYVYLQNNAPNDVGLYQAYGYSPTLPHKLTEVWDGNRLLEAHEYDANGRVNHTYSEAGNNEYTLAFDAYPATQSTVTNGRGVSTEYNLDAVNGFVLDRNQGPGCASCGGSSITTHQEFDGSLNITRQVDGRGIVTTMTYDASGNVLTRTEGFGTPLERTTTTTYDANLNLPTTISVPTLGTGSCATSRPNKVTTRAYDPYGNLLTETVSGCNRDVPFDHTTTYTYDARGRVLTVDGPRDDVSDLTTYEYYADDQSVPLEKRGRLYRVTDAAGNQTTYNGYDFAGNLVSETDPNGVETTYEVGGHNQVLEIRIKGATPEDDIITWPYYESDGNLDRLWNPICAQRFYLDDCDYSTIYQFDEGNRLKQVQDIYGNTIRYTYDVEGNKTREENLDPGEITRRATNFAYDGFNRLKYVYFDGTPVPPAAGSVFYEYAYFDDGMLHTERDPEGHVTSYEYDELKRRLSSTQTVGTQTLMTTYAYDAQDNLIAVTDPGGLTTHYVEGDAGWRLGTTSPDMGTTSYAYDPAGNLLTITNANGVTISRTYDALGRLTTTTYPDTAQNVTYSYDSPSVSHGKGRRTGMSDPSGTSVFSYERRGLLTSEDRTVGGLTYNTGYDYDLDGNLTQVLYPAIGSPSRRGKVSYGYDDADRVTIVTADVNGATTTVASGFAYEPFGPRSQMTFGNGLVDARTFDNRYRLGTWTLGSLVSYTHTYDGDGNLVGRTDNFQPSNDRAFGYDAIHRLTSASGPWGNGTGCPGGATYTYDANGNRLCKGESGTPTAYAYTVGTNRLVGSTGGDLATYGYDANGNTTSDGTRTFQYSQANRLASVDSGTTATYLYDGDNRRTVRTVGNTTTYFFYDSAGKLLQEYVPATAAGKDYAWLENAPIARVDWSTTEQAIDPVLTVSKAQGSARLDWTPHTSSGAPYVVRRKQVVDPQDRSFTGAQVIATLAAEEKTFDDPVLGNGNRYDYRVFEQTKADALFYYHTDHLGTAILMTSGGPAPAWRGEHLPFGGLWSNTVTTIDNNLRFPGQYFDAETVLTQNWFREYQPAIGRFVETDPVHYDDGFSPYTYAWDNPVMFDDVQGLYTTEPGVPLPLPQALDKFMQCMDACTGRDQHVNATTNGRHQDPGHAGGSTVDLRPIGTPSKRLFCCAGKCGAPYALDERNLQTKFHVGPHYHLQLVPPTHPNPKAPNAIPPECEPNGCDTGK